MFISIVYVIASSIKFWVNFLYLLIPLIHTGTHSNGSESRLRVDKCDIDEFASFPIYLMAS